MANLRFAVLGAGFGAGLRIPSWFEVGGEFVAPYNRTLSRAEAFAHRQGTPQIVGDPETLLRPLQAGDAPALLTFYNGFGPASIRTFRPLGTQTTLAACDAIVRGSDPIQRTRHDLVAARAGEIVGWAFLAHLDAPPPSLGLGIADAWQGQGLGSALLDRLLAWAAAQAIARVCLIAVKDNARAVGLYGRRGFVTYGEFVGKLDGLPYVRMAVELSPPL